ncbi:MAG: hypothetical protein II362_01240 [Alistipes sp.]|nr:hypothetical protein [Alistipes sp.]MBQ5394083.1 hypothetical protein [Alistipes sp.]MBQ5638007.1 hypothetical protein [Alistipes sp.]
MNFDNLLKWIRRSVSPVFIVMLVASFILWYIAKLSYTYTTEQTFRINIDGEKFEVTCVVEGIGTNLFGYRVYHDKSLRIPLSELRSACSYNEENYGKVIIEPQSLQNAISVRCTDIKIISIGDVPEINQPKK